MENLTAITIFSHQYTLLNSNCVLLQKVLRNKCCSRNHTRLLEQWSVFFLHFMKTYENWHQACLWLFSHAMEHKALSFGVIMQGHQPWSAKENTTVDITHCPLLWHRDRSWHRTKKSSTCTVIQLWNKTMSSMLTLESALICELIFAQRNTKNTWKQMQMQSE